MTPATGPGSAPSSNPWPHPDPAENPTRRAANGSCPINGTGQRLHDALDDACARLLRAGDAARLRRHPRHRHPHHHRQTNSRHSHPNATDRAGSRARRKATGLSDDACGTESGTGLESAPARYRGRDGSPGRGSVTGVGMGVGTVECSTGDVLSVAEALRLAAEAEIVPAVMTAAGRPLHLGRTRRCATTSQTYALIARDGGCSFPGCTIPPEWCERHHLTPWAAGGTTDTDNLTLSAATTTATSSTTGWTATLNPDGLPEWRPTPASNRPQPTTPHQPPHPPTTQTQRLRAPSAGRVRLLPHQRMACCSASPNRGVPPQVVSRSALPAIGSAPRAVGRPTQPRLITRDRTPAGQTCRSTDAPQPAAQTTEVSRPNPSGTPRTRSPSGRRVAAR